MSYIIVKDGKKIFIAKRDIGTKDHFTVVATAGEYIAKTFLSLLNGAKPDDK